MIKTYCVGLFSSITLDTQVNISVWKIVALTSGTFSLIILFFLSIPLLSLLETPIIYMLRGLPWSSEMLNFFSFLFFTFIVLPSQLLSSILPTEIFISNIIFLILKDSFFALCFFFPAYSYLFENIKVLCVCVRFLHYL